MKKNMLLSIAVISFSCGQMFGMLNLGGKKTRVDVLRQVPSSDSVAQQFSSPFLPVDTISPRRLSPLMTEQQIPLTPERFSATPNSRGRSSSLTEQLRDPNVAPRAKFVDYTNFCVNTLGCTSPKLFADAACINDPYLVPALRPVASKNAKAHKVFIEALGGRQLVDELNERLIRR